MWKRTVCRWVVFGLLAALVSATVAEGRTTTTVIRTRFTPQFGRIVAAPSRHTLYVFCAGAYNSVRAGCRQGHQSWRFRPLIATGSVVTTSWSQVKPGKLGTRKLPNGQRQVTYYGEPLYLDKEDHKPGQTNGDGQYQGSGAWYVITPEGEPPVPEM